jgi:hypothetical protein
MKRIKLFLPILALSLFSCSDYLDINTSPNNPNAQLVTPNLALAGAHTQSFRPLARTANVFGNIMMNNWGFNVNAFAVTNPEEFSLNINTNTGAGIWDGLYLATANYSNIIKHPSTTHDNHKAIAKIMKSYYFQYLVDLYGDIPYFGAHQGTVNLTPSYDDDMVIYRDLVTQVEEAIAMIENPVMGTSAVGAEDVILGGNMQAWKRFGNTLKLRLLLRQSELNDAETQAYLAAEFAELANADFITADVTINPGYANDTSRQNPFYDLFYLVGAGSLASRETTIYRQYRASKHIADELNSSPVDPRRGRLFVPVGTSLVGVIQGDSSSSSGGTAPANLSPIGPGVLVSSAQPGYIMLHAESLLLRAEAALRGYLPGDAQALFNAAITASFAQLGAAVGTYITDVNTVIGKGLAVGSFDDKIEAIMYQKNIALMGSNSIEAFIEATRTGYIDTIPLALGATRANRFRRLLYPNTEIAGNSANVPNVTLDQVFTQGAFWFNN